MAVLRRWLKSRSFFLIVTESNPSSVEGYEPHLISHESKRTYFHFGFLLCLESFPDLAFTFGVDFCPETAERDDRRTAELMAEAEVGFSVSVLQAGIYEVKCMPRIKTGTSIASVSGQPVPPPYADQLLSSCSMFNDLYITKWHPSVTWSACSCWFHLDNEMVLRPEGVLAEEGWVSVWSVWLQATAFAEAV